MNLEALKSELDAGHPDTGPYNADQALASDELNAINRPAVVGAVDVLDYLVENTHRVGSLYGRIAFVAGLARGDDLPMGNAEASIGTADLKHIAAAKCLLRFTTEPAPATPLSQTAIDSAIDALAGGADNAQCMGPAHKSALQGLVDDLQSRAQELGLGRVRPGDVVAARAL